MTFRWQFGTLAEAVGAAVQYLRLHLAGGLFGLSIAYRPQSEPTSRLLSKLFEGLQRGGRTMPFTMEDFNRQYIKEHFSRLTPEEQAEVLRNLPPEQHLAGLSADEIRQYLDRLTAERPRPAPPAAAEEVSRWIISDKKKETRRLEKLVAQFGPGPAVPEYTPRKPAR